jgi:Kdo2-lipid IVA lauroyltransferase/acyltransferase
MFALILLDSFWFMRDTRARIEQCVRSDESVKPFLQKRAQMCLTAHMGNWEVLGQAAAAWGFPLTGVADPLANPAVDELFKDIRFQLGLRTVPRRGAVRELLKTLRHGDKLGLLLDQNTKPSEGGLFVNFFGLPVPVSAVGSSLALRANAEIVFGFCLPQADGSYLVYSTDRLQPAQRPEESSMDAIRRITQEITDIFEREVRRHPETWLWTYKRWKYVAPDRKREEYPFYSKMLSDTELRAARGGGPAD